MRHYTREFKEEALRLIAEHGGSIKEIAASLGVPFGTLYYWQKKAAAAAAKAARTPKRSAGEQEEEIKRLHRELERVRMERDFLKKAAAFFAKNEH